jgi:hypothetical protein
MSVDFNETSASDDRSTPELSDDEQAPRRTSGSTSWRPDHRDAHDGRVHRRYAGGWQQRVIEIPLLEDGGTP